MEGEERTKQRPTEESLGGETGAMGAISPQYPATMADERGSDTALKSVRDVDRGIAPREYDSPLSTMSISLSVSKAETELFEGMQLGI